MLVHSRLAMPAASGQSHDHFPVRTFILSGAPADALKQAQTKARQGGESPTSRTCFIVRLKRGVNGGVMRAAFASILALLLVGYAHGRTLSPSHDVEAVKALEIELCSLLEHGDFDGYATHLTSDYALTSSRGEFMTRDQALAG